MNINTFDIVFRATLIAVLVGDAVHRAIRW